ncbi:MAG: hypothetical protein ACI3XQ_01755 [Eubacteriales bacterium]
MKKIVSLILLMVVCLMSWTSCRVKDQEETNTTNNSTTASGDEGTAETEDPGIPVIELPEVNYGGYSFRILVRNNSLYRSDFFSDEGSTDVVDMAVRTRNQYVSDTYGVNFVECQSSTANGDGEISIISSGEDAYDLIAPHGAIASTYAYKGVCADWYQLPYINIMQKWWNQSARECFTLNGKIYFITGDISHLSTAATYCVMFNKDALTEKRITLPYEEVKAGTWTFEKMANYSKMCADDRNGDGEFVLGVDRMGYVTAAWAGTYCTLYSSGNRILSNDSNGIPYVSLATESTYNALVEFYKLVNDPTSFLEGSDSNGQFNAVTQNGLFVFEDMTLSNVTKYRGTDLNYGLVPFPKMSEDADGYHVHMAGSMNQMIVPITCNNYERTSVILEALCQKGTEIVIPAYYDNVVTRKSTREPQDYEMLSYISDARVYDLGYYYNRLGTMNWLLRDLSRDYKSAERFYSLYQENIEVANQRLQELLEQYQ